MEIYLLVGILAVLVAFDIWFTNTILKDLITQFNELKSRIEKESK